VPLERAWTIGMPFTSALTSEWVWPETIRSSGAVIRRAASTISPT
jgi:hypothetical protein